MFSEPNVAIMNILEILILKYPLISQYEVGDSLEHHPLVSDDRVDLQWIVPMNWCVKASNRAYNR